nr:kinase-like domain-containing protein [Tanacetum cinerariifolium]
MQTKSKTLAKIKFQEIRESYEISRDSKRRANYDELNVNGTQRIKIRLQVARGLSYLHTSEGDRQEIVYRDTKSANILLGENLDVRIGDFGLYTFLFVNEEHKGKAGTPLYMDPQYAKEDKLKKELDIHNLGVVLIEIRCGQLAYDLICRSDDNRGLALTARQQFDKGTVKTMVDGRLELSLKSATRVNQDVALSMLSDGTELRMRLPAVVPRLHKAVNRNGGISYIHNTKQQDASYLLPNPQQVLDNWKDMSHVSTDSVTGMVGLSRDTIGDSNGIKLTDSSVSPQTNNKSLRNEFLQGKLKARAYVVVMTENEIHWLY